MRIACRRNDGSNRDCRTRVAARGLEHDVGLDPAFTQLLGHHEAEIGAGDDDRAREQVGSGDSLKELLEGRCLANERHELLGHALAR